MKKIFVMLLAACLFSSNIKAQDNNSANVKYLDKWLTILCNSYGIPSKTVQNLKRSPESGIISSRVLIVPFNCSNTYSLPSINEIIEGTVKEFKKGQEYAYSFSFEHPTAENMGVQSAFEVLTGDTEDSNIVLLNLQERQKYEVIYLEMKNEEDPTNRDFYAMAWKNDATGISGIVCKVTSKRPDLIKKDALDKNNSEKNEDAFAALLDGSDLKKLKALQALAANYKKEFEELTEKYKKSNDGTEAEELRKNLKIANGNYLKVINEIDTLIRSQF